MKNLKKNPTLLIHLIAPGLFLMMFSPRVALALPHEAIGVDGSPAARRALASAPSVRIEGVLSCATGTGENCVLNIQDERTGKTYRLGGQNRPALEFFKAGAKKIAVEGTVSGGDTLDVEKTEAL